MGPLCLPGRKLFTHRQIRHWKGEKIIVGNCHGIFRLVKAFTRSIKPCHGVEREKDFGQTRNGAMKKTRWRKREGKKDFWNFRGFSFALRLFLSLLLALARNWNKSIDQTYSRFPMSYDTPIQKCNGLNIGFADI